MVETGCVSIRASFCQIRRVHLVRESFLLVFQQEFCRHQLDPPQLVARLRHGAWTTSASQTCVMILPTFAIPQFVRRNFEILQLVCMNFVSLQLECNTKTL